MADLVLGLAKSAVEGTLRMAKSAMEEEEKLTKSVQRDLMLISDEFEMMHSFLNIAAKERDAADDMMRTLVRQVRNMALDVEDCIECVVHLDTNNSSNWWRRLLPSCMPAAAPAAALDDAVAGIELLKARVEAMGQRKMRYGYGGDSSSNSSSKPNDHTHHHHHVDAAALELDILVEARDTKKRQGRPRDLAHFINKKGGDAAFPLQVISVWGAGGDLGVASIIKSACDDPEICTNFLCRGWVKLMHPFNPLEFIRSLLAQFYMNYCAQQEGGAVRFLEPAEVMVATEGVLVEVFMKLVSNQRFLIFLEDVSTMVDWEAVRVHLPDKNNGSCIVVHTQQIEIASLCVGQSYRVSELEQFSVEHSVCLFFNENREDEEMAKMEVARGWLEKFQLVGQQTNIRGLGILAADPSPDVDVIPVCGIAGVGKSSLVRQVYYKTMIEGGPFKKFGWVDVSHPLNLMELSRSLLLDLHSGSRQQGRMLRIKGPIQECRELLHKYRCLIVINNLQFKEEWNLIKDALAIGHHESRIIVIAHDENVARYSTDKRWWFIEGLEIDEALALFERVVSQKTGSSGLSPEVIEQAKPILHMCGGLPKVIIAVADFVATRLDDEDFWESLSDDFMHELETHPAFGSLQDLFAWVHSYFRSCPDFLKPCIFYLSIFPLNHSIRRRRLVRRWIAEGYSRDTEEITAEENAEWKIFHKLFLLSMIMVPGQRNLTGHTRMPMCRVNGFLREYIISRPMEENLVFALEGNCSMTTQRTGQHLTISSTWDRDRIVFESIDFSRLRSLTVFGKWESFFVSDKMRLLRVLDLEDVSSGVTNSEVEKMVKLLPRLKFISFRGCTQVSRLPDSLGGLGQLQTLDIRRTSIAILPQSITKLQKLQYIRAGTNIPLDDDSSMVIDNLPLPPSPPPPPAAGSPSPSLPASSMSGRCTPLVPWLQLPKWHTRVAVSRNSGVEVPRGIGQLIALHTLGVVDVSVPRGRAILKELKNLTQLRKLGVSGINHENCDEFCAAISGHGHLESLSVRLDKDTNQFCLDGVSDLDNLDSLKLYGHVQGKLPTWIGQLPYLCKLNLEMTMLPPDELEVLGSLPELENLRLCFRDFQDGELRFRKGFKSLVVLEIACNSRLEVVAFHNEVMDALEWLKLRCCQVSSLQFSGLEELADLKQVSLGGSYGEALMEHLQGKLGENSWKLNLF